MRQIIEKLWTRCCVRLRVRVQAHVITVFKVSCTVYSAGLVRQFVLFCILRLARCRVISVRTFGKK